MLEFLIQSMPVSLWTERLDSEHWPHVRLRNADTDEAHDGRGESTGYRGADHCSTERTFLLLTIHTQGIIYPYHLPYFCLLLTVFVSAFC